ncbi:barstar family protein [Actinomadura luteofluorescens]|uniref:Barstar (barnase inhibitor) domain-containing protein n=1 Tax=Actinomadura luteofluorescens TaxID=46163 RepID=A0A7Y9ECA1_9ACTN|nr:barstar family protein [Actinomadura luteofluorescens]NYD44750.1 hypothetical protein [Actinomadura luteofluorescens]
MTSGDYVVIMEFRPGVTAVDHAEAAGLVRTARDEGAIVHLLAGAVDRTTFFEAVRSTFPLDPPLSSSHVWDALEDSLWEGLLQTGHRTQVIVWPDASAFQTAAPNDYATAIQVLTAVSQALADREATVGNPVTLSIFVTAHGT